MVVVVDRVHLGADGVAMAIIGIRVVVRVRSPYVDGPDVRGVVVVENHDDVLDQHDPRRPVGAIQLRHRGVLVGIRAHNLSANGVSQLR